MTSQQILATAIENGVFLYVQGEELKYRAKADGLSAELRQLLKQHRQEIILHLKRMQATAAEGDRFEPPPIHKASGPVPLSYAQQRLWFIERLEKSSVYMQSAHRLTGALNVKALEDALNTIVERHEALRTVFAEEDGALRQIALQNFELALARTDLCGLSEAEQEAEILRLVDEDAKRPFDLSRDLQIRVHLLTLAPEVHVVVLNQHHMATDAWSGGIFRNELVTLYSAYCEGRPNPLAPLNLQYADYTMWQRSWLQGEVLARQLEFWKRELQGIPEVHGLPLDRDRSAPQIDGGGAVVCKIGAETLDRIRAVCKRHDVTLFMFLHTALAILLSRYSGETDIVVGTPVSGRVHPELESIIGLFINTVILRLRLDGDPSVEELLGREKQRLLDALSHQHVPFDLVVETLKPRRSTQYPPIFQILFNMQPLDAQRFSLPGLTYEAISGSGIGTFDLSINVTESADSLSMRISHRDLFSAPAIARMAANFQVLLSSLLGSPGQRISSLDVLTPPERNRLLTEHAVYILDPAGNLMPEGAHGELCVPATALSRFRQDVDERDVHAQIRSMPNPFANDGEDCLWRTGQLARWLPDGELELLGRVADRVIVAGVRVNLAGFRAALMAASWIARFAIVAREDAAGREYLVAYAVAASGAAPPGLVEALRNALAAALEVQDVPFALIIVERIPLASDGALMLESLPAPDAAAPAEISAEAPSTDTERRMERVWRTVLPDKPLGVDDNFFAVGGHSLAMIVVIKRIGKEFGVEIPLATFMEAPTIQATSAFVEGENAARNDMGASSMAARNPIRSLSDAERSRPLPLSFNQETIWTAQQRVVGFSRFNLPGGARISGPLCVESLRRTFETIVARHAILRTIYREGNGGPVQVILAPAVYSLPLIDLSALTPEAQALCVEDHMREHAVRPFDLTVEPSLRVLLLKLSDQSHVCLVNINHIASDGSSMAILFQELKALYSAYRQGRAHDLPHLGIQYCDYAVWQRESHAGGFFNEDLEYWGRRLSGIRRTPRLPFDKPRPIEKSSRGAFHSTTIDAEIARSLDDLSRSQNGTLFMILQAALAVLMYRSSGESDIVVVSPIANRLQREVEPVIGYFVNGILLRSNLANNPRFIDFLGVTIGNIQEALAHQAAPFALLVDQLNPQKDPNLFPLVQVQFALQNFERESIELPGIELTPLDRNVPFSMFDLTLRAVPTERGLWLQWEYAIDIFNSTTIERLAASFGALLDSVVRRPEERADALSLTREIESPDRNAFVAEGQVHA